MKTHANYLKKTSGKFRTAKNIINISVLLIFFILPFATIDRGTDKPSQALLLNMFENRIYILWLEIFIQDIMLLFASVLISLVSLFLFTKVYGRIWCGFSCPQTIFCDLYSSLEMLILGERNQRIKLAKKKINYFSKLIFIKLIWLIFCILVSITFISYFQDSKQLWLNILNAGTVNYIVIIITTLIMFVMTSVAKEKFCTLMCPYSKFQSMMFNNDTIMVHYNSNRGEPRGSIKDNNEGDCIDCNECVNVCPTNIDIRNGIQIECISCGLCIDACNKIMDKVSKPRNLIEYNNYDHTILSKYNKFSLLFRKKNLFLLLAIIIIFISSILYYNTRSSFNVTIEQIRNPLFIKMTNGAIRNKYKVHVFNKSDKQQTFTFKLNNNAYLIETNKKQITIDGFKSKKIILFITQKSKLENHLNNSENLVLKIYNNQAIKIESSIKFITNKK